MLTEDLDSCQQQCMSLLVTDQPGVVEAVHVDGEPRLVSTTVHVSIGYRSAWSC